MSRIGSKWSVAVAGMTMALGGALAGCKPSSPLAALKMQRPPVPVVTATAVAQDVPVYIDQIGKTVSTNSVMIQPQVGGKITEVHFTDGADVTRGQLLFTIDPRPFQAALAQAQATLEQSQANFKFAKVDYQRVVDLRGTGAVTPQDIDTKQNTVAVDEAQVAAGKAALETAKLNLEYCEIRSPLDGRAGARMIDPGNVVLSGGPSGGTNLLRIEAFNPIYVDFPITEAELATVRKYMAAGQLQHDAQGRLKVLVDVPPDAHEIAQALGGHATTGSGDGAPAMTRPTTMPAGKQTAVQVSKEARELSPAATQPSAEPHEGVLTFLDNAVQDGSGTIRLRATVPNSDHYFWPGQLVRVKLVLTVKKDAVLVPKTAQQIGQQGPYVYVVQEQGTTKGPDGKDVPAYVAKLQPVEVGQDQGDLVVINGGLKAGERVVVTGQMAVTPDGPVIPMPQNKPTAVAEGR